MKHIQPIKVGAEFINKPKFIMKYKTRIFFLISLLLIAFIFILSVFIAYKEFSHDVIKKEYINQHRTAQVISEILQRYFGALKFITQNAAVQPAFKDTSIQSDEYSINQSISPAYAKKLIAQEGITYLLANPKAHPAIKISTENKKQMYQGIIKTYFSKQAGKVQTQGVIYNNEDKLRLQRRMDPKELTIIQDKIEGFENIAKQRPLSSKETKERFDLYQKIGEAASNPANWPNLRVKVVYLSAIRGYQHILDLLYYPKAVLDISSKRANKLLQRNIQVWQLTKGLPYEIHGKSIAAKRRLLARNILSNYPDLYNVFQVTGHGRLLFLEPYSKQKESTAIDFDAQYYLRLISGYEKTFTSEVYQSLNQDRIPIISVASPVFNDKQGFTSIVGVSVSAATLQKQIFLGLLQNKIISKGTNVFLMDRYGHVVASSSGQHLYVHNPTYSDDLKDPGNFRNSPIFKSIKFLPIDFDIGITKLAGWHGKYRGRLLIHETQARYKNLYNQEVIGTFLPISLDGKKINWGILIETPVSQVLAASENLKHIFYIAGACLALILVLVFIITIKNFSELELKIKQKEKESTKLATQTAHDIRSPLVALDMLLNNLTQIEEEKRLTIRHAINRITDIANGLLNMYKKTIHDAVSPNLTSAELISLLIEVVISEKRTRYADRNINFVKEFQEDVYTVFVNINRAEFNRAISNLIDNAVEAITGNGLIIIRLIKKMDSLKLYIIDNGCGISRQVISKIKKEKISIGKAGTGLGLSYAMERFAAWNCTFEIQSEIGKGSSIEITLPQTKTAEWFMPALKIRQGTTIAILDNEESIHSIWKQHLQKMFCVDDNINVSYFSDVNTFLTWQQLLLNNSIFYLIDYDLNQPPWNGLNIIKQLNIADRAVLVTSWYEEESIREECKRHKLKMLPKSYIAYIPIDIIDINPDFILIDDNISVTTTWKIAGKAAGKKVAVFNSINDFIQLINLYDKNIPIYVDSDLDSTIKGEMFAKTLYEEGYQELYLATGYDKSHFIDMPWIKKIVGKEPPFIFDRGNLWES